MWFQICQPALLRRGRGFCSKHGNLLGLGGLKCTAPNCTKSAVSKNLCCEHGGVKRCTMKGCQKMERGNGYCNLHTPGGTALPAPEVRRCRLTSG